MDKTAVQNHNKDYIKKAIQFMNSRISDKLMLEDIASELCLSKCHFLRLFKTCTNISPMIYFLKMKINRAADLLTTSSLSIGDISESLSFNSPSHFNRTFKKYKQCTPSDYRKKYLLHDERYLDESEDYNWLAHSLLQTIVDSTPDLIFYKDLNSVMLGCNVAFCRVMGLDKKDIVGKHDKELFPSDEADFYFLNDQETLAVGGARRNKEWMTLPDGTMRRYEVIKAPFYDNAGNVEGLLGISRDCTGQIEI